MSTHSTEFVDLQQALAGEYSLERELGRGGMGVVYLARDVQLDRHVAIKVLPAHLAAEPEARERFLREARTAAGLSHPHIVPIHRVGEAGGFVFFVMSYVAGETLGERLRANGALASAEVTRILREVSWALAYAHGRGVVHRDVKPDNILLEEGPGRALVSDFGIARVGTSSATPLPGKVMGTAQFMSPEQAMNLAVDGRSDLYALGVVGYLAASGRLPFEAASVSALLALHVADVPRPLHEIAPGTPHLLARAIHRCLAKDPAERFASGEARAAALMPESDGRPQLSAALRTWLTHRNPATVAYAAWSGLTAIPFLSDLGNFVNYHHLASLLDMGMWVVVATLPVIGVVAFHTEQARNLFRAGYTLADLRGALEIARRERHEAARDEPEPMVGWAATALRVAATGATSLWLALTFGVPLVSLTLEKQHILIPFALKLGGQYTAFFASLGLLLSAKLMHVPILPDRVRRFLGTDVTIRERLWQSRCGAFVARRFGAPERSRPVGIGVFQPTELALDIAAADLFAALPAAYRAQLGDLPSVVASLRERAEAARREIESLDVLPQGAPDATVHSSRRAAARTQLSLAVAALEGVRIDLLRLHAGASDLAPLTTLLDAARELGAHATRIAEAQREVSDAVGRGRMGPARVPTPA
ncbi:MAG: serine/threonine-protein kinase [bacterium]